MAIPINPELSEVYGFLGFYWEVQNAVTELERLKHERPHQTAVKSLDWKEHGMHLFYLPRSDTARKAQLSLQSNCHWIDNAKRNQLGTVSLQV